MDDFMIRVTPEMLISASTDVSQATSRMNSASSEMSEVAQRTASYWAGDAAELHRTLLKEQLPKLETVISHFVEHADRLGQIAANYSGASQAAKTAVEELPSDVII